MGHLLKLLVRRSPSARPLRLAITRNLRFTFPRSFWAPPVRHSGMAAISAALGRNRRRELQARRILHCAGHPQHARQSNLRDRRYVCSAVCRRRDVGQGHRLDGSWHRALSGWHSGLVDRTLAWRHHRIRHQPCARLGPARCSRHSSDSWEARCRLVLCAHPRDRPPDRCGCGWSVNSLSAILSCSPRSELQS